MLKELDSRVTDTGDSIFLRYDDETNGCSLTLVNEETNTALSVDIPAGYEDDYFQHPYFYLAGTF